MANGITKYLTKDGVRYLVNTTFVSKDKVKVAKGKRGFKTVREAELWKQQTKVEIASKNYDEFIKGKTQIECKVEEYIEYKKRNVKPKTLKVTNCMLNRYFTSYFKDINLEDITINVISNYNEWLIKECPKQHSFNTVVALVHALVDWLELMEYIDRTIHNKFKLILEPKKIVSKEKVKYLEPCELKAFLEAIDEPKYKVMFTTLAYSGLRIGELLGLQVKDMDLEKGILYVHQQAQPKSGMEGKYPVVKNYVILPYTKTNVNKEVAIPKWLCDQLKSFIEETESQDDTYLFISNFEGATTIGRRFKKYLEKVNLSTDLTIHKLRHTYVSLLLDKNADVKFVAQQVGHKSEKTTLDIYQHITEQREKNNINIVNDLKFD